MTIEQHERQNYIILRKLQSTPAVTLEQLDVSKSKRMGGVKTNYIPTLFEVARVIRATHRGQQGPSET